MFWKHVPAVRRFASGPRAGLHLNPGSLVFFLSLSVASFSIFFTSSPFSQTFLPRHDDADPERGHHFLSLFFFPSSLLLKIEFLHALLLLKRLERSHVEWSEELRFDSDFFFFPHVTSGEDDGGIHLSFLMSHVCEMNVMWDRTRLKWKGSGRCSRSTFERFFFFRHYLHQKFLSWTPAQNLLQDPLANILLTHFWSDFPLKAFNPNGRSSIVCFPVSWKHVIYLESVVCYNMIITWLIQFITSKHGLLQLYNKWTTGRNDQ